MTAQGRVKSWAWRVTGAGWNQQPQQGERQCRQVVRGGSPHKEKHLISVGGLWQRVFGGQIQKKKVKSSPSSIAPICTVQCSICSMPPNREEATLLLGLCLHQHSSSLAWEGSKYSECDTAQSSRKLGDFSWKETWGTLLKDGYLTRKDTLISNCKPGWKTDNQTRSSYLMLMNYHHLPALLRYLYASITVMQKHMGFLIPRGQEAPLATRFRYENWDTEGNQVHIPGKERSVDSISSL